MKRKFEALLPAESKKTTTRKLELNLITKYFSLDLNALSAVFKYSFLFVAMDSGLPNLAIYALNKGVNPYQTISDDKDEFDGRVPLSIAFFYAMQTASRDEGKLANDYVNLAHLILTKIDNLNEIPTGTAAQHPLNALFEYYDHENPICRRIGLESIRMLKGHGADFTRLDDRFREKYILLTQTTDHTNSLSSTTGVRLVGLGGTHLTNSQGSSSSAGSLATTPPAP